MSSCLVLLHMKSAATRHVGADSQLGRLTATIRLTVLILLSWQVLGRADMPERLKDCMLKERERDVCIYIYIYYRSTLPALAHEASMSLEFSP